MANLINPIVKNNLNDYLADYGIKWPMGRDVELSQPHIG